MSDGMSAISTVHVLEGGVDTGRDIPTVRLRGQVLVGVDGGRSLLVLAPEAVGSESFAGEADKSGYGPQMVAVVPSAGSAGSGRGRTPIRPSAVLRCRPSPVSGRRRAPYTSTWWMVNRPNRQLRRQRGW